MELVIVERRFEAPVDFAKVQASEDEHAWCLRQHDVRFLRSYFARDRQRMICLYLAPDAEAVRRVNDVAGLPYEAIWSGTEHLPPGL